MRLIFILISTLLFNFSVLADLIKANPSIQPEEVVRIQLDALMNNNTPFADAGIAQTWEFAHPVNRQFTGPLSKFLLMMKSEPYSLMLEHKDHNIIFVSKDDDIANYFVELTDKIGNKFGFTWTVKKVLFKGSFKDCWMTSGVSRPMPLAKTA